MITDKPNTEHGNGTNTMLAAVREYEKIDEQVREYLLPKLHKLYDEKKLNDGKLPNKKATEAISINSFEASGDKISVSFDIYWGWGNYDGNRLAMTNDEWDAI